MGEKVRVAVYDNDQKIRTLGNFEVSDNGEQIRIKSGGTEHFMPRFDSNSFLEFPSWKKYLLFGPKGWKRVYIVKNKAERCVNFKTQEAYGPSPEELKKAVSASLLEKIGKEGITIPWYLYLLLVVNLLFSVVIMNVLGVF